MATFEAYLRAVKSTRASDLATPENSYLEHLKPLFETALEGLGVSVIVHPKNADGSGLADIGLFETDSKNLIGVVEAEAPTTDIGNANSSNAKSKEAWRQAKVYSSGKGPTLLTNFHEFILVENELEVRRVSLGGWQHLLDTTPAQLGKEFGQALTDLLRDWASRRAAITSPAFLAERLADYAREALKRLEAIPFATLNPLRKAMQEALGITFEAEKGEHFFRSSLVQALFYGLFSAWVVAAERGQTANFNLEQASANLRVPLVTALFDEVARPRRLRDLGLGAPVSWALEALRRVVPDQFIGSFEAGRAVQYFYEPFLEKFDPQLRKDLGVWYTPPEIVRYQIERTHALLQSELGIAKGLLDDAVTVLDPAVGTGSYLVELARFILEKLGDNPLKGLLLKKALTTRIYGFEILPAPFVIAHLQLGLLLDEHNASLSESERVGVYLTNSLLNWTPSTAAGQTPIFPEFAREQEAAERVKQQQKILVFIGNPPYDRFAGTTENEEATMLEPYKRGLLPSWGIRKQTLDDLYIRFIRLAEWRITQHGGRGLISFITNRSFLTGISHPVMREHLLQSFDDIYIDDLHGSQRANRENDGSVFTTASAAGIRVGVAITQLIRKSASTGVANVHYREFFGSSEDKRQALLEQSKPYSAVFQPKREHRYLLKPLEGADKYWTWPTLPELFPVRFVGVHTGKDEVVISESSDSAALLEQFKGYYDVSVSDAEMLERVPRLMTPANNFGDPSRIRQQTIGTFALEKAMPYLYRPFDLRWIWYEQATMLIQRKNERFGQQIFEGNAFLSSTQTMRRGYDGALFGQTLTDLHIFDPDADAFPTQLRYQSDDLYNATDGWELLPNTPDFYDELVFHRLLQLPRSVDGCPPMPRPAPILNQYCDPKDERGAPTPDAFTRTKQLMLHALAVMNAPAYRTDFSEYLSEDWARIPLPANAATLETSAELGARVAALIDPSAAPDDLPSGVGVLHKPDGTPLRETDLRLETRYSYAADTLKLSPSLEVQGVSQAVWDLTLGGYPVLKKWLDYRRGRTLTLTEGTWLSEMIQRLHALIELGEVLNSNYALVSGEVS